MSVLREKKIRVVISNDKAIISVHKHKAAVYVVNINRLN